MYARGAGTASGLEATPITFWPKLDTFGPEFKFFLSDCLDIICSIKLVDFLATSGCIGRPESPFEFSRAILCLTVRPAVSAGAADEELVSEGMEGSGLTAAAGLAAEGFSDGALGKLGGGGLRVFVTGFSALPNAGVLLTGAGGRVTTGGGVEATWLALDWMLWSV